MKEHDIHVSAIEQPRKYVDFILKASLSDKEKDWVIGESITSFWKNLNPEFLQYRKSVSTDYTAIEWSNSGTTITDINGKVFIDRWQQASHSPPNFTRNNGIGGAPRDLSILNNQRPKSTQIVMKNAKEAS